MKYQYFLKKSLFVFSIIILFFLLLEITVRITARYNSKVKLYCFHRFDNITKMDDLESIMTGLAFPMRPYANFQDFILNSKGFRTPEYIVEKLPNSFRIVNIGDSFLSDSGVPYPYHFTVIIEENLRKIYKNKNIEMINLGIPGTNSFHQKRILEIEGFKLNPDVIVWYFFVGNDLSETISPNNFSESNVKEYIFAKSYMLRLINNIYKVFPYYRLRQNLHNNFMVKENKGGIYVGNLDDYDPDKPTFSREDFLSIQCARMCIFSPEKFPYKQWEYIKNIFIEVKKECEYFNIPFFVVIIPDQNQIEDDLLQEVIERMGKVFYDFDIDYPQILLSDFFEKNNIQYLNLLPLFRIEGSNKKLYKIQNTHWNEEGNILAAKAINNFLIDNILTSQNE